MYEGRRMSNKNPEAMIDLFCKATSVKNLHFSKTKSNKKQTLFNLVPIKMCESQPKQP